MSWWKGEQQIPGVTPNQKSKPEVVEKPKKTWASQCKSWVMLADCHDACKLGLKFCYWQDDCVPRHDCSGLCCNTRGVRCVHWAAYFEAHVLPKLAGW